MNNKSWAKAKKLNNKLKYKMKKIKFVKNADKKWVTLVILKSISHVKIVKI